MGASVAVLAAVALPGALGTHTGPDPGPGPDRPLPGRLALVPDPDRPPRAGDPPLITGYVVYGRGLTVYYRVRPLGDCSGRLAPPVLHETSQVVRVRLALADGRRSGRSCGDRPTSGAVGLRLERAMGARLLRDAGRGDALVTPQYARP